MQEDSHLLSNSQQQAEAVREVKHLLRAAMNGPLSQSMRQKGLAYRVIFGVELPRLEAIAQELPHDYALGAALWREDIRECRLLAPMLMPTGSMDAELADVWLESMHYPEEVDVCVLHLWQYAPWASSQVFRWLAAEAPLVRYAGYALLRRLLVAGKRLTTRDAQEFLDHAATDLRSTESRLVQMAAYKTVVRYCECGMPEERMGSRVLNAAGL